MSDKYLEELKKHPAVRFSRLKTQWPFLVWVAAVIVIAVIAQQETGGQSMSGVIYKEVSEISSVNPGQVKRVSVIPGQKVDAGQILVELDTGLIDAEIKAAAWSQDVESRQIDRQFTRMKFESEADLQEAELRLAQASSELQLLDKETQRIQGLVERRLVDREVLLDLEARRDTLKLTVASYPDRIERLKRYSQWAEGQKAALLEKFDAANQPQKSGDELQKLLELKKEGYSLRASGPGYISLVHTRTGEVVDSGEPLVTVVGESANRVIGFLPEKNARELQKGSIFYVSSSGNAGPVGVPAKVVSLSPEIIGLPQQAVLVPGRVIRGRQIMLEILEPHTFIPGEAVMLRSKTALKDQIAQLFSSKPEMMADAK